MEKSFVVALSPLSDNTLVDLAEWIRMHNLTAALDRSADHMGPSEVATITLAGTAALRGLFLVVREWIRARQTSVDVSVDGGARYTISLSTDLDGLLKVIESIQEGPAGERPDEDV